MKGLFSQPSFRTLSLSLTVLATLSMGVDKGGCAGAMKFNMIETGMVVTPAPVATNPPAPFTATVTTLGFTPSSPGFASVFTISLGSTDPQRTSLISVFSGNGCSGSPIASGTLAQAQAGFPINAAEGANAISARAYFGSLASTVCSPLASYVRNSSAGQVTVGSYPAATNQTSVNIPLAFQNTDSVRFYFGGVASNLSNSKPGEPPQSMCTGAQIEVSKTGVKADGVASNKTPSVLDLGNGTSSDSSLAQVGIALARLVGAEAELDKSDSGLDGTYVFGLDTRAGENRFYAQLKGVSGVQTCVQIARVSYDAVAPALAWSMSPTASTTAESVVLRASAPSDTQRINVMFYSRPISQDAMTPPVLAAACGAAGPVNAGFSLTQVGASIAEAQDGLTWNLAMNSLTHIFSSATDEAGNTSCAYAGMRMRIQQGALAAVLLEVNPDSALTNANSMNIKVGTTLESSLISNVTLYIARPGAGVFSSTPPSHDVPSLPADDANAPNQVVAAAAQANTALLGRVTPDVATASDSSSATLVQNGFQQDANAHPLDLDAATGCVNNDSKVTVVSLSAAQAIAGHTFPITSEGSYAVYAQARSLAGGVSACARLHQFAADHIAPSAVRLASAPLPPNSQNPIFRLVSDAGSSVQLKLTNTQNNSVAFQGTYTSAAAAAGISVILNPGVYAIRAVAVDPAGNSVGADLGNYSYSLAQSPPDLADAPRLDYVEPAYASASGVFKMKVNFEGEGKFAKLVISSSPTCKDSQIAVIDSKDFDADFDRSFQELITVRFQKGGIYPIYLMGVNAAGASSKCSELAATLVFDNAAPSKVVNLASNAAVSTSKSTTPIMSWAAASDGISSGAQTYKVSIGKSPGASDIRALASVGSVLQTQVSGLSLSPGTYYFNVFALDGVGNQGIAASVSWQVQGTTSSGGNPTTIGTDTPVLDTAIPSAETADAAATDGVVISDTDLPAGTPTGGIKPASGAQPAVDTVQQSVNPAASEWIATDAVSPSY